METHEQREKLKREFEENLKNAVRSCKILMVKNHAIAKFDVNPIVGYDDIDEKGYEDGNHNYNIGASIRIYKANGEYYEKERSKILFSAKIDGTNIEIDNGVLRAEYSAFSDSEILQLINK